VIIQKRNAYTWPDGQTTPAHEAMPSPRDWGKYGWTYQTTAMRAFGPPFVARSSKTPVDAYPLGDPKDTLQHGISQFLHSFEGRELLRQPGSF
jgi:hypothetical protein